MNRNLLIVGAACLAAFVLPAIKELFGMFGFSFVVATLAGLIAVAQYFISAEVGVQGG